MNMHKMMKQKLRESFSSQAFYTMAQAIVKHIAG
jgi:hypothetical protein